MKRWGSLFILFLLAASANAADLPNVVLITLDTVRADRMGFLGSKRGLTPNLDAVARDGVVYAHAYAQAPLTTVSHATILTGTYPQFHQVNDFSIPLPARLPVLAELLKGRGYKTAAFVGSLMLDPIEGMAPGFDRGFDTYNAGYHRRQPGEDRYKTIEHRAEQVVAAALLWLKRNSSGPFFLWVHLYDPHDPYDPPPAFTRRFPASAYDAEIAYTDAMLGRLFETLRTSKLYDTTAIAILADHGESLGAHGENTHGVFLYDETIHVPLVLKLPQGRTAGQRVDSRVALADVAPSLLEIAGVPLPASMQGQSLVRLPGRPPQDRPVYSETDFPLRIFGWSSLSSWRSGKFLYVRAPKPELYDVSVDSRAKKNLAATNQSQLERLAAQAEDFRKRSAGAPTPAAEQPIDPKLAEKLSALGYVAGSNRAADPGAAGVDPKDKIGVANALHDAVEAMEGEKFAEAISLLERVVVTDPQIFTVQLNLGTAYVRQRNYVRAIPPLRTATEIRPDAGLAQYELGLALSRSGDLKTAGAHFEIAAGLMPKWPDTHYSLASVWARTNRVPEAMQQLRVALELDPRHYPSNLLIGRILFVQGKAQECLPYLERAAAAAEAAVEAHQFLADAYGRLGRNEEAARARARAEQLRQRRSSPTP